MAAGGNIAIAAGSGSGGGYSYYGSAFDDQKGFFKNLESVLTAGGLYYAGDAGSNKATVCADGFPAYCVGQGVESRSRKSN